MPVNEELSQEYSDQIALGRRLREAREYLDQIQVGVAYVNRSQGATTGAWPGYQSFGGWKGSGCSGRGSGGPYYLLSYMREQSQTVID